MRNLRKDRDRRLGQRAGIALLVGIVLALLGACKSERQAREPPSRGTAQQQPMTDQDITAAVESEFVQDPAVPFNSIDVQTREGVVILTGSAGNLLASERAVNLAQTVRGVRSVVNQLSVAPPLAIPDETVKKNVEAALLADPATDSYEITTSVMSGITTLTGLVQSWQERMLAEKVAKGVAGVRQVKNGLLVETKETRPDAEIGADVQKALRWDTLVDHALIEVAVRDGRVTLSGTVGSAAEKTLAVNHAWVAGTKDVTAEGLKVERWARDDDLRKGKYASVSDAQIAEAIETALRHDPRVASFEVTPLVQRGIVTLRGTVDNLMARRSAERDAANTVGVIRVENRVRVRPVEVTDKQLAGDVRAAMQRNPLVDDKKIAIRVVDGFVYLTGSVDSYLERAYADQVTSRVNGVVEVRNQLGVDDSAIAYFYEPYIEDPYVEDSLWIMHQPRLTLRSDEEIRKDIQDELWWSPFVDSDEVKIEVRNGTVTLTGTVDSRNEMDAAMSNAFEGGASWVVNKLKVKGT